MSDRIKALDGLRGFAALVVVCHHALLLNPVLAGPYTDPDARPSGVDWWLLYTPLHTIWNGAGAVWVFFVLSGYVLALPVAAGKHLRWASYYPRRLVRLYLPVWAAVAFAVTVRYAIPVHAVPGGSWWFTRRAAPSWPGAFQDVILLGPAGMVVGVLWSLRWEVWFSLLLPLFVLAGARTRRFPGWLLLAALIGVNAVPISGTKGDALNFLPMFACGVALAFHRPHVPDWAGACGLVVINGPWLILAVQPHLGRAEQGAGRGAALLGATLLVGWAAGRQSGVLTWRVAGWLGSRSFSLYLVHDPILVTAGLLLNRPWWVGSLAAVPVSLAAAEVFWRLVERPSTRLAKTRLSRWSRPSGLLGGEHGRRDDLRRRTTQVGREVDGDLLAATGVEVQGAEHVRRGDVVEDARRRDDLSGVTGSDSL